MVGGGISGAILGGLGAKLYALAGDGLFRIPGMINPAGLNVSFYGFIACAVLAFGVSAVLAYIVQGKEEKEKLKASNDTRETENEERIISIFLAAWRRTCDIE